MSTNPIFHAHTKHIQLDYHFVREKLAARIIVTKNLTSTWQVATMFTKALSKQMFVDFRFKLGVYCSPLTSLRGLDKSCITSNISTTEVDSSKMLSGSMPSKIT